MNTTSLKHHRHIIKLTWNKPMDTPSRHSRIMYPTSWNKPMKTSNLRPSFPMTDIRLPCGWWALCLCAPCSDFPACVPWSRLSRRSNLLPPWTWSSFPMIFCCSIFNYHRYDVIFLSTYSQLFSIIFKTPGNLFLMS